MSGQLNDNVAAKTTQLKKNAKENFSAAKSPYMHDPVPPKLTVCKIQILKAGV